MPKSKETISESDSGSSEEEVKQKSSSKPKKQEKKKKESSASEASDSEEEVKKDKKRTKKSKDDNKSSKKAKKENDSGESYWELDNKKRITVRSFKGKLLIDIREFYEDSKSGDLKPGKKGISLNPDSWHTLTQVMDEVNQCIKSQ